MIQCASASTVPNRRGAKRADRLRSGAERAPIYAKPIYAKTYVGSEALPSASSRYASAARARVSRLRTESSVRPICSAIAARLMRADALIRLHDGDADGAARLVSSMYRLADHLSDDRMIVSSLVAMDYDRDVDLDLVQTCAFSGPLRLLENQRSGAALANNHLVIRPRMAGHNHRAIGAVVRLTVGVETMTRLITAGTSILGQEPAEAFFGLGTASAADNALSVSSPRDGGQSIKMKS